MGKYVGMKACNMGFDAHLTVHYINGIEQELENKIEDYLNERKNFATKVFRTGIKLFGYRNIPVMTVSVLPELAYLKEDLEKIVPSKSDYDWNPHITIKLKEMNTITLHPVTTLDRLAIYD